jgi:membrane associated rhomboid family serine protease
VNRASQSQLVQIFSFLAIVMAVHVINIICGMWLNEFGVVPRSFVGSRGILFSPLLHGNWTHLIANLAPLGVMLCLLGFVKGRALWPITALIWLATGLAIWIVGRPGSVQIGASGLIYGLAAFLVATAWFKRDLKSALAALVVIVLYGSIVWGLLPSRAGVSWEGHLSGAVAGILVAVVSAQAKESRSS